MLGLLLDGCDQTRNTDNTLSTKRVVALDSSLINIDVKTILKSFGHCTSKIHATRSAFARGLNVLVACLLLPLLLDFLTVWAPD